MIGQLFQNLREAQLLERKDFSWNKSKYSSYTKVIAKKINTKPSHIRYGIYGVSVIMI